jgi:hypothetical protein
MIDEANDRPSWSRILIDDAVPTGEEAGDNGELKGDTT